MTAVFEHIRKYDLAPASALARKAVAIKTALAASWPPAMIGLGFLLTLAWSGGLLWLFVRTIVALVCSSARLRRKRNTPSKGLIRAARNRYGGVTTNAWRGEKATDAP